MKIISFDDIKKLNIAPQQCYQWVCEMIAQKKSALLPEKINMKLSETVFCNVMPCVLGNYPNIPGGG